MGVRGGGSALAFRFGTSKLGATARLTSNRLSKILHYLVDNVPCIRVSGLKRMVNQKKGFGLGSGLGIVVRPRVRQAGGQALFLVQKRECLLMKTKGCLRKSGISLTKKILAG